MQRGHAMRVWRQWQQRARRRAVRAAAVSAMTALRQLPLFNCAVRPLLLAAIATQLPLLEDLCLQLSELLPPLEPLTRLRHLARLEAKCRCYSEEKPAWRVPPIPAFPALKADNMRTELRMLQASAAGACSGRQ